jgi:hypothetical protein
VHGKVGRTETPLLQKATLLVGFKKQTRAQHTYVIDASTSFGPSSAFENPLEGVDFCRKGVSTCLGRYCLLHVGLCRVYVEVYAAILGLRNASETVE